MLKSAIRRIPKRKVFWENEVCGYGNISDFFLKCAMRCSILETWSNSLSIKISNNSSNRVEWFTLLHARSYFSTPLCSFQPQQVCKTSTCGTGYRRFCKSAPISSEICSSLSASPKQSCYTNNVDGCTVKSSFTLLQNEKANSAVSPTSALNVSELFTKKQLNQAFKDFMVLSKNKLSIWVVLSTLPGHFLMMNPLPISGFCCFALGTYFSSACAAALNQLYEQKQDAIMLRTKNRPLVSGRMSSSVAKTFALISGSVGVGTLLIATSPLTASISALTIALYVCVYTPLKVISPYNTHVGAIVGSLPILMGCTAAGCSLALPEVWLLFSLQYLWQFPHFYSLAWLYKEDYSKANFKMFPLSDNSGLETAKRCYRYLIAIAILPVISSGFGLTSWMFVVDSLCVNAIVYSSLRKFKANPSKSKIRTFFLAQVWQILALLLLAVYHCKVMINREDHFVALKNASAAGISWNNGNFLDTIRVYLSLFCPHLFIEKHPEACPHQRVQYSLPFFGLFPWTQQETANDALIKQHLDFENPKDPLSQKSDFN